MGIEPHFDSCFMCFGLLLVIGGLYALGIFLFIPLYKQIPLNLGRIIPVIILLLIGTGFIAISIYLIKTGRS